MDLDRANLEVDVRDPRFAKRLLNPMKSLSITGRLFLGNGRNEQELLRNRIQAGLADVEGANQNRLLIDKALQPGIVGARWDEEAAGEAEREEDSQHLVLLK